MKICWNSDPRGRAKFADLEQRLSSMLEQEAGYLSLRRFLTWKTHGETPKKAAIMKAPILQSVEERVMGKEEESVWLDEENISGASERSVEANERDSAV